MGPAARGPKQVDKEENNRVEKDVMFRCSHGLGLEYVPNSHQHLVLDSIQILDTIDIF